MFGKKTETKKTTTKPAAKKAEAKATPKNSEVTYSVTCDKKGNITKIVPEKKK